MSTRSKIGAHCLRDELTAEPFSRGWGVEADTPLSNIYFRNYNISQWRRCTSEFAKHLLCHFLLLSLWGVRKVFLSPF